MRWRALHPQGESGGMRRKTRGEEVRGGKRRNETQEEVSRGKRKDEEV